MWYSIKWVSLYRILARIIFGGWAQYHHCEFGHLASTLAYMYSKTSPLRPSELRTPPLYGHWLMVPNGQPQNCVRTWHLNYGHLTIPYYRHMIQPNDLYYNTDKAMPPSLITSASTAVQHESSLRWLVYQTKMPNIEISLSTRPPLGLLLLVYVVSTMQVSPTYQGAWLAQPPN